VFSSQFLRLPVADHGNVIQGKNDKSFLFGEAKLHIEK
jgi:hypothetical protein